MDFLPHDILHYAQAHSSGEPDLLKKINRETNAQVLMPRMLSGHLQGRFLSLISKLIRPSFVLEIGTYTGYSAICLAEGLAPEGKLYTIDINDELESRVRSYFAEAGLTARIDYRIGDAGLVIPTLRENWDLVFIDADKENYGLYYDLVIDQLKPGGVILADNVLWSGKVLLPEPDKDTKAIIEFNKKIHRDERVECLLLPVRDGIMLVRKK
jgi:caffeoyl-CoA O-methyltransferase